jgi:hypothetical protein
LQFKVLAKQRVAIEGIGKTAGCNSHWLQLIVRGLSTVHIALCHANDSLTTHVYLNTTRVYLNTTRVYHNPQPETHYELEDAINSARRGRGSPDGLINTVVVM